MKLTRCPDCKGTGTITLFTSAEKCRPCAGGGFLMDQPLEVTGYDPSTRTLQFNKALEVPTFRTIVCACRNVINVLEFRNINCPYCGRFH